MEKTVLAGASYSNRKFFMDNKFSSLPEPVKKEIKSLCVLSAERLMSVFLMGFNADGEIYFEILPEENFAQADDIGAEYVMSEIRRDKAELLKALKLWYIIFKDGKL
ncbi:MAG: DUF6145 family protein [Lachnospiraceae bacterium]|nr:DUF6145 family protein [Lachnospiraceae bacterium]